MRHSNDDTTAHLKDTLVGIFKNAYAAIDDKTSTVRPLENPRSHVDNDNTGSWYDGNRDARVSAHEHVLCGMG